MKTIEYFKLQAKNLHKDFKTQKPYFDPSLGDNFYEYEPKFFDVDALVTDFDIDEDNFTLMNAQHVIAKLVGFEKWTDMIKASSSALELSKLLFANMHKIRKKEWEYYILDAEDQNDIKLDDETKLDIFIMVFASVDGHQSDGFNYRLSPPKNLSNDNQISKPTKKNTSVQISALPLNEADLKEFIELANKKFEDIVQMMEPRHPELVRKLWNAEHYIAEVLSPDMLPIDRDYALSLIEAVLVHHCIDINTKADNEGLKLN